jgi:hypothetical protein
MEDDTASVTVPRLMVADADLDLVHLDGDPPWRFPEHLDRLEARITGSSASFVVLDPLDACVPALDSQSARSVLDALAEIAHHHEVAILGLHHFTKSKGTFAQRLGGGRAVWAVPRSIMALVSVDPMLRLVLDPPRAISWSCCTPRRTTTPRPRPFCWSDSATTGCSCSSRQLGGASGPNAALEHREARAHPGNILLLDWVSYSAGHPGWFQPDRLHLTLAGASAFTDLLASALPYAYVPCPGS